jgi:PAS domain S-box-containing protein
VRDELTDLSFANLVDIEQIRELLEAHYKITGVCAGILDTDENILVAVGYHDICTRFHLVHPLAKLNCRESDAYIKAHLSECSDGYLDYRCKNGLVDVAVPIIIRGEHFATFFTGQFFYDDDKPDTEYFRKQAEKFGFDETGYLEAMGRVPIFTRDHIQKIVEYYRNLVRIIAGMGLKNLELSNGASERNEAEEALLLSRFCIDKAGIGIYHTDENGTIFSVNDYACTSLGYSKEELCALSVFDIDPVITGEKMSEIRKILETTGSATHETIHRRKDGTTFPVEITTNLLEFHGKSFAISFVKDITERKRVEEERWKSEENFSIIFQTTPDLIAITRASDGTILEVNEAFSRLLRYSRAEAIGKCTEELFIWADTADRARWMAELEATGQVNEFETTLRCRDGSLITCVSTARPLDFGGEKCVLSVVRDISERKQAEEELRLTQFCVDKASLALYQLTEEGDIWNVNECACQSLGYSMEELRSMTVFDIDPAATREVFNDLTSKTFASGSITFERIHKRKDGTTFPVEITANSLEFRGRKFGICFVKDITERKQAEEELRENEERLRFTQYAIEKTIGQAFWMTEEGRLFYVNAAACRALGYTREELLKLSIPDIDPIYQPEKFAEHWRDLQENGYATFETLHRTKDGRVYPVEIRANYVVFDDKEYNCAFATDITDRKLAEEELRRAHADLESRVRGRTEQLSAITYELSIAEERERRRIATELHDQVGQTLILSKIKLDSLSRSLPSESLGKQIGEISKYLDQSIQDIRSLTFQLSPPLLYEVGFEAAVEWLGEEFEEKYGFQVEFRDDGKKKPLVEEASVALYQMVRELLLNVAKHAKAKRVRISVEKVSGKIKVIVADDGSGFDQLNGMRRKNKKSGFGLFNIRHRIEYMGGEFKINSKIDHGTSVTLTLPIKQIKIQQTGKNHDDQGSTC